jgi:uncharacterized cupredoxin-like copper-binding protein
MATKTLAALAVAAVLALAACGGGGGGGSTTNASDGGASSGGGKVVKLSMSEFKFSPSAITLNGAGTYTFQAKNDGGTQHAIKIEGNGLEKSSPVVGPGETATLTVQLESGDYKFDCPVDGHEENGMKGTITVS